MRTRICTAAAVTLLLAISGCGGDDDDEGATSDTVAEPAGGDTGDAVDDSGGEGGLTMSNFAFNPSELTVASGGTIAVSNEDSSSHTFTSEDAGIDLPLGADESGEVTVDAEPGTYDFLCTIHPSMQGTLTVE